MYDNRKTTQEQEKEVLDDFFEFYLEEYSKGKYQDGDVEGAIGDYLYIKEKFRNFVSIVRVIGKEEVQEWLENFEEEEI